MAGGSVRAENIKELLKESGVVAVHARATDLEVFKNLMVGLRLQAAKPINLPEFVKPEIPEHYLEILEAENPD
jgi:copper homeostasis protein CutC